MPRQFGINMAHFHMQSMALVIEMSNLPPLLLTWKFPHSAWKYGTFHLLVCVCVYIYTYKEPQVKPFCAVQISDQPKMGSCQLQIITAVPKDSPAPDAGSTGRDQRIEWMLNCQEPPSFLDELLNSIRQTIFLNNHNKERRFSPGGTSGEENQSSSSWAPCLSLLKGLFPILSWGRSYKVSEFKSDLMAGLTLASLCIPQVVSITVASWFLIFFFSGLFYYFGFWFSRYI